LSCDQETRVKREQLDWELRVRAHLVRQARRRRNEEIRVLALIEGA